MKRDEGVIQGSGRPNMSRCDWIPRYDKGSSQTSMHTACRERSCEERDPIRRSREKSCEERDPIRRSRERSCEERDPIRKGKILIFFFDVCCLPSFFFIVRPLVSVYQERHERD